VNRMTSRMAVRRMMAPEIRRPVDPKEKGWEQRQHHGNRVEELLREAGIRLLAQIRTKAKLIEGDGSQVQHAGTPDFTLPVDVVHVVVGALDDSPPPLRQQLGPPPELYGSEGTSLDASRELPLFEAVEAHLALPDLRVRAVVLELGHIKGAGDHAEPAPHALVLVPGHRTGGRLVHGLGKARGGACRLKAMHALFLHRHRPFFRLVPAHDAELVG